MYEKAKYTRINVPKIQNRPSFGETELWDLHIRSGYLLRSLIIMGSWPTHLYQIVARFK